MSSHLSDWLAKVIVSFFGVPNRYVINTWIHEISLFMNINWCKCFIFFSYRFLLFQYMFQRSPNVAGLCILNLSAFVLFVSFNGMLHLFQWLHFGSYYATLMKNFVASSKFTFFSAWMFRAFLVEKIIADKCNLAFSDCLPCVYVTYSNLR